MRFVIANVLLFVAYTGIGMIGTWINVRGGWDVSMIHGLNTAYLWSAILAACAVNWRLLRLRNPVQRILIGIGLGTLTCAIAFIPYISLIIPFHLSIGGSL